MNNMVQGLCYCCDTILTFSLYQIILQNINHIVLTVSIVNLTDTITPNVGRIDTITRIVSRNESIESICRPY